MKTQKIFPSVLSQRGVYQVEINQRNNQVSAIKCQNETKEPRVKCRHVVVSIGFFIFFLINGYRLNMSIGIVAMVNRSAISQQTKAVSDSCPHLVPNASAQEDNFLKNGRQDGEFAWSPRIQGYILGSYFIGYVITLIPAGLLVERFGCKWFLFATSFVTAICTFLIPLLSSQNASVLIVLQTLRGLAQGFIQPASSVLTANWFPKPERGFLNTIMQSGFALGACLGSLFSGFLCSSAGRWPSSFYTFGTAGIVLSVLIACFLYESPKVHPKISKAELDYILNNQESKLFKKRPQPPWRKILKSIPTYALIYGCFGQLWAVSQFLIVQSTFLGTILHYPIAENGFYTAVPFLLQFVAALISGWLSAYMLRKKFASLDFIRKFWSLITALGFSACLLGVYFAGCDRTSSILFAMLSTGFTGFALAGCWIVSLDMAPTFAGSLNALSLFFASLSSVAIPLIVGHLTDKMQTIEQWNKVFFISIGVVMSSGIVFAIFGSAEVQPWNFTQEEKTEEVESKKTRF